MKYSFLKYEDQSKLRASIVLDYYLNEVNSLKDEELSFADKERKQQVVQLIKNLTNIKIIDAPILMKLYDLYRMKIWSLKGCRKNDEKINTGLIEFTSWFIS